MPEIIKIDPLRPDPALIGAAVKLLKDGGVITYPTETFYGLGADCLHEKAIDRLFDIKGRDYRSPIALIGGQDKDLELIADNVPEVAKRLIRVFWPGPLTLIFQASLSVPTRLTGGTGKIGIRLSGHAVARALALALDRPITATSANLSGQPECVSADDVCDQIGSRIDLIIDGGRTAGGKGSTMLDLTAAPPAILRHGAIAERRILQILG